MGNPLILLVIWFVINLLLKSAKDKRKVEEARRKRVQQLSPTTKNIENKRTTFQEEIRRTVSTIREEIEKEVKKERQGKAVPRQNENVYNSKMETNGLQSREKINWDITSPKETKDEMLEKSNNKAEKSNLDIKNDVLKGIIFSEILSEPKAIQNLKRNM